MAKKKKVFNLEKDKQATVFASLRKASQWWPPINECKKKAKTAPGYYRCAMCNKLTTTPKIDHINPVVPLSGFVSFDHYIDSLFCDVNNLQCLCKNCHDKKTKEENKLRKFYKEQLKNNNKKLF